MTIGNPNNTLSKPCRPAGPGVDNELPPSRLHEYLSVFWVCTLLVGLGMVIGTALSILTLESDILEILKSPQAREACIELVGAAPEDTTKEARSGAAPTPPTVNTGQRFLPQSNGGQP